SGGLGGPASTVAEAPETPGTGTEPAATTAEDLTQTPPEAEAEETPPPAPQEAAAPEPDQPAAGAQEKFTQRLMPDGSEVDEGPAGGQPGIGEGSSVATAAQSGQPSAAAQPDAGPGAAGP